MRVVSIRQWFASMPARQGSALWGRIAAAIVPVGLSGVFMLGLSPEMTTVLMYLLCVPLGVYVVLIAFWPAIRTDIQETRRRNAAADAEEAAVSRARETLEGGGRDEQQH